MITRILIVFLMTFWLLSCAEDYSSNPNQNPSTGTTNSPTGTTYTPTNHTGNPSSTTQNPSCNSQGKWGGVTCKSGSNQDQNFLNFLSNGTDINPNSPTKGVGTITCTPSDSGGFLFRMKVTLNAPFNPNGPNDNLAMQPASSTFEFALYDSFTGHQPISAIFEGLNGEVNGQNANLNFIYNGSNGRKTVRLEGTINAGLFSGVIFFENDQYWDGRKPGASGTLGDFKIASCSIFTSN